MKDIDDLSPRGRLEKSLPLIAKLVRKARFRYAMSEDEAEEFHAALLLKLVEHDYAILRRFKGRSRFSTYLTTVVQHALLDFRDRRWGRWRPSAAARRRGDLAVRLETLIVRDGYDTDQAIATLVADPDVDETSETLEALAAALPRRVRRRIEGPGALERLPSGATADERLARTGRAEVATAVEEAAAAALDALPAGERLLIRLRFLEGFSVREIADRLGLPAKPLYRRFEGILKGLRATLEARGVDWSTAAEIVGRTEIDLHLCRSRSRARRRTARGSGVGPGHRIHAETMRTSAGGRRPARSAIGAASRRSTSRC